ncbi:ABC transporter ATP-binding protein [Myroides sp. JBRI-B21084]|uniref:ABC transporter ATP-binding protein n=1 Tax=Myroides sp. JBRI-B21084 TaxID=3119977 RepID=UPI0026E266B3|nr:ABC transporter ATP-binding protein [Paenimyroides cloacae]WKW47317.1 ABC transporter ATP-binding protein [Paenimyroides cloacae]
MLQLNQLSFSYQNSLVINHVSFQLSSGKSYALIGASGSGKSTLLKLIYGLLDANSGSIFWNDTQILGPAYHLVPGMDFIKYLAQDFDLMPFVSVEENVGRFLSNFYLKEKKQRVAELLELVGMTEFANVKAKFLSGGQMQRTALAKVLALQPQVLLLDEPFSHIDFHLKSQLAQHVFDYCKSNGITVIYTSHTPNEILMFSDEVLVMQAGKLIEKQTTINVYKNPKSIYSAQLTGEINSIPARYFGFDNDETFLLRPHELVVDSTGFEVTVTACNFVGSYYVISANLNDVSVKIQSNESIEIEKKIKISITS